MSTYRSSRPCQWVQPRPYRDASLRLQMHGPILPMEYPRKGLFARIWERLKEKSA